jgi:hypothetical protein
MECAPADAPCANYPVDNTSAAYMSSTLDLGGNAQSISIGQWVYLRGDFLFQGEYHGEFNQVADVTGNLVTLQWPLRSDFTADSGLQLDMVSSADIIQDVSVTDLDFQFASQVMLAAQTLNFTISNNTFTDPYGGGWTQFNQNRGLQIVGNTWNGPSSGTSGYLDPSRNPTDTVIDGNTFHGVGVGAGEDGANVAITNNTFTNVYPDPGHCAVDNGSIYGLTIQGNTIDAWGAASSYQYAVCEGDGGVSPLTQISGNTIGVHDIPAFAFASPGVTATGNTIYQDTDFPGGDYWIADYTGGVDLSSDTFTTCSSSSPGSPCP